MTYRMSVLSLALCVTLLSLSSMGHTDEKGGKSFDVYQNFGFSNMPFDQFKKYNIKPLKLYGHGQLWVKNDPNLPNEPNIAQVKKMAAASVKNQDVLVSLDIELWSPSIDKPAVTQNFVRRFSLVADAFHQQAPDIKFGFYAELPQRNYWDPVRRVQKLGNEYAAWQKLNRDLQPIADKVDVIMPSLYTFYKDPEGWRFYAEENIKEARKYGKPVYVYLWPQYSPVSEALIGTAEYMSYDAWKQQLETVYELADGVIIWTPKGTGHTWDTNAPWWRATQDFLEEKHIGQTPDTPILKLETE